MTIRAKLYAAMAMTVLGPVITIAVAFAAFQSLSDRFDEVVGALRPPGARAGAQVRGHRRQRLADRLRLRRRAPAGRSSSARRRTSGGCSPSRDRALTEPRERAILARLHSSLRRLHGPRRRSPTGALRAGPGPPRQAASSSAPRSATSRRWRAAAGDLAAEEQRRNDQVRAGFDQAPDRRQEGPRGRRPRCGRAHRPAAAHRIGHRPPRAGATGQPRAMTRDVILTLSLLLVAGLFARLLATLLRVPGDRLPAGRSAPCSAPRRWTSSTSRWTRCAAQLVFTLGVSTILFYGGLNLSLEILRKVWLSLGLLAVVGVIVDRGHHGHRGGARLRPALRAGPAHRRGALPHRPGHPHPALHRLAAAAEGRADRGGRVGLQRPDGRGAGAGHRRVRWSPGKNSLTGPAGDFVGQLALSTAGGVLAGIVLSAAISSRRTGIWRESAAIAVLAVVAMSYVSLDFAGGSGYLGAFLAGLIVGNMKHARPLDARRAQPRPRSSRRAASPTS